MTLWAKTYGEGPPLVLLHGFTGSAATWDRYAKDLRGFRVLAIDLPGHGASAAPASGMSFEEIADAVVAVLDDEGVERCAWLGYSMGGRVALQVLVRHPGRVERIVIESASPGLREAGEREARAAADDALAAGIERDGLEPFVERWARQPLFASQKRVAPEDLDRERRARLQNTATGLAAGLRALSVGRQPSLWSALGAVQVPLLAVVGAEDPKYLALGESLVRVAPGAELRVVAEAGHTVHLEQPGIFWSAVRSFLLGGLGSDRG
ncbi:MAG: 2-succinyl-6-hydroxy-2,4-cyclohexadiene-1-carboxylate synthase [Candidatus Binatia bacterium]|nr:2-succinyl-6-hydroxy-2,4-cyclohexadiene-1-carboxylate synthase [Candidatus Binatia bacterium]